MEVRGGKREKSRARAGSSTLAIFGHPLSYIVLRAHADGPLRFGRLEGLLHWVPQTSLRMAVSEMRKLGALTKLDPVVCRQGSANELTPCGRDLLEVGDSLEHWLRRSPSAPLALTSTASPSAIKALVAAWDSAIVRELAERPLTPTELSARLPGQSDHALGRRLAKLRATRLAVPLDGARGGRPFEASDWLRHAVAPLCVAARWERTHLGPRAGPIGRLEVESAFLLTLPLVKLDSHLSGACALAVMTSSGDGDGQRSEVAGVALTVEDGAIASCLSTGTFSSATWALGTPDAWLAAAVDGDPCGLRVRGEDERLPLRIVEEIHDVLFSP
jgi:DNA-binding HxlR family transcriptional regulator